MGKTTTATADQERRTIRDAMDRLLDGQPIRSDGKLTVKSLADEAAVKRWMLTHRHPDLQDEFRARIAAKDALPSAQQALADDNAELTARVESLRVQLTASKDEAKRLARVVQVLTLENENLRSTPTYGSNVRPLHRDR